MIFGPGTSRFSTPLVSSFPTWSHTRKDDNRLVKALPRSVGGSGKKPDVQHAPAYRLHSSSHVPMERFAPGSEGPVEFVTRPIRLTSTVPGAMARDLAGSECWHGLAPCTVRSTSS